MLVAAHCACASLIQSAGATDNIWTFTLTSQTAVPEPTVVLLGDDITMWSAAKTMTRPGDLACDFVTK